MSMVIAAQGNSSEKLVNGEKRTVVPFVGSDREGEFSQMGVGILGSERESGLIWGLVSPHLLIQSWRGMKILERVQRIEHSTLYACWAAARREINSSDERTVSKLVMQFGGREPFEIARRDVLAQAPSAEELDSMIAILIAKGVDVDTWELDEEIQAGRIATSSLIEILKRKNEERRAEYQRQDEEINRPLPNEESLGVFFSSLGIDNFIIGGGFGGYGMDWGHIKLEALDPNAKRDSFSKYARDGYRLQHTTEKPRTMMARLGPGVEAFHTSYGQIEQPWFKATNGTKYTFVSAKYRDGYFTLKVVVQKPNTAQAIEGKYTLAQLREMIGPLPQQRKGIRARLAALIR